MVHLNQNRNFKKNFKIGKPLSSFTDIKWQIVNFFPPKIQSLIVIMRLDRPVGVYLCLWPALWGLQAGAYPSFPFFQNIFLFVLGAFLVRAAGCVLNDLWDKNFDRKVKRTKSRPLASGAITVKQAFIVAFFLFLGSLGILLILPSSVLLWGVACVPLIAIYPLFKRITYWPQLFLGIVFNWGIFLGWITQSNSFSIKLFLLYGGSILWTLGYDTVYACQDKEDDLLVGVKSSALALQGHLKPFLVGVYTGAILLWGLFGFLEGYSRIFFIILGLVFLGFLWQSIFLNQKSQEDCLKKFKSNIWIGALVSFALLCAAWIR